MNNILKKWVILLVFILPLTGLAQENRDQKMEERIYETDTSGASKQFTDHEEINLLNAPNYFNLLTGNLKESFTKPFHATTKDWGNFGKFALLTVAVSFADKPVQKEGLKFSQKSTSLNRFSGTVSDLTGVRGSIVGLVAIGSVGFIIKKRKLVNTTLLASQASITGSAITTSLKYLTGRRRPYSFLPSEEARPKFEGPFSKTPDGHSFNQSFPSGHTTSSFAIATVFASEYRNNTLVPVLAYSLASLVGISRIAQNEHWSTDVLTGAAIGYISGKQVVNNFHKLSKKRADGKTKNTVLFNLHYTMGHWEPGLVLHLN